MAIIFGIFWKRKDIVENELKKFLKKDKAEFRKKDETVINFIILLFK